MCCHGTAVTKQHVEQKYFSKCWKINLLNLKMSSYLYKVSQNIQDNV